MDFIIVIGIGAILVATGVIEPKPKDNEVAEAEVARTEEVAPTPPEIKPEPEPTPEPANEPEPEPAKEPEPEPAKEPEPESKEEVNQEQTQQQDAKPEEPEIEPTQDSQEEKESGGWLNIVIYILGAIAVIAARDYYYM